MNTKRTRTEIVRQSYQLAKQLLLKADVEAMCIAEGMSEEDAQRMAKQIARIAESLGRRM